MALAASCRRLRPSTSHLAAATAELRVSPREVEPRVEPLRPPAPFAAVEALEEPDGSLSVASISKCASRMRWPFVLRTKRARSHVSEGLQGWLKGWRGGPLRVFRDRLVAMVQGVGVHKRWLPRFGWRGVHPISAAKLNLFPKKMARSRRSHAFHASMACCARLVRCVRTISPTPVTPARLVRISLSISSWLN